MKNALVGLLTIASIMTAADMAGNYVLEGVREMGSELMLKPDGTFEYMLAYGALDRLAQGTWKVDGDSVVLNSEATDAVPLRLVRSAKVAANQTRVLVRAPNGRPVQHIEVKLDAAEGQPMKRTDEKGVAVFPEIRSAKSVSLRVPVYDVNAGPFALDPARNEFQFEINGDAITQVPFKNERLKINGNDLEMRFWDPGKPMRYRRS